jgi:hypothetical protein
VDNRQGRTRRPVEERLVKEGTHDPLIDRHTWALAQEKLAWEREQLTVPDRHGHCHSTRIASRNPDYWLRSLFLCGHCGRPLAGRTETDWRSGKKRTVYVCSTYVKGRCGGHAVPCGYQTISHSDAEQLLLDKIKELNLVYDELASGGARDNLRQRLELLGQESARSEQLASDYVAERVETLNSYFTEVLGWKSPPVTGSGEGGDGWRFDPKARGKGKDERPDPYDVEAWDVQRAKRKLASLTEDHTALTLKWAKATDGMQAVLLDEIKRLEAERDHWQRRAVPLEERFEEIRAAEADRQDERQRLLAEWPALEGREKGEAFRRLFKAVKLFWERRYHPASERPTRPRRTNRPGRYSYHLDRSRIEWELPLSDLGDSW